MIGDMNSNEVITETDLAESQFPWDEIDEMAAEDFGRCCHVLPCLHPESCPR